MAIHVEELGRPDGQPLLMLMGLGASSRGLLHLAELLAPDLRVILVDHRGTGRSPAAFPRPFGLHDLADDAVAAVRARGIESAHVFGISMGGMVAQHLATRHPDFVRTLVLGCTFPSFRASGPRQRWQLGADLVRLMLRRAGGSAPQRMLISEDFARQQPDAFPRWFDSVGHAPRGTWLLQFLAIARHDAREALRSVRAPTLILTGTADRLVAPHNSRRLAALIDGSRLVELPGAGHVFPLERPEETRRAIVEHVSAWKAC